MDWNDLRIFRAVAEAPSLTLAAARLRLSVATVSRRLTALEAASGLTLLVRSAGGIALTPQGRALHARVAAAATAMDAAERTAAALRAGDWSDPVRISATEPVIAEILAPALPRLLAMPGAPRVDLVVESGVVSLAARDAELAIRLARPAGDGVRVRSLPPIRMGLYAGAPYLAGRALSGIDLRAERFIGYDDLYGRIAETVWIEAAGFVPNLAARMSSTRGLVAAVAAGAGVAVLPAFLAARQPGLVALAPPQPLPERPVWLVTHRDLGRVPALRTVRAWVVAAFNVLREPAAAARAQAP